MRIGVVSDVHANLPALEATLAVLARQSPDALVCAGDVVGYGAFPDQCVGLLRDQPGLVCVAGNHDLIAVGRIPGEHVIRLARETLAWTTSVMSEATRVFLEGLPLEATISGGVVAHGALDDPERYVRSQSDIAEQLALLHDRRPEAGLLILGHTHRAGAWSSSGAPLKVGRSGRLQLSPGGPVLVNPGSVGQSRGLRVEATCLLVDTVERSVQFHRVPYDAARCRTELARVGLPTDTYHLPPWRTARRLAPARRLYRKVVLRR